MFGRLTILVTGGFLVPTEFSDSDDLDSEGIGIEGISSSISSSTLSFCSIAFPLIIFLSCSYPGFIM